MALHALRVEGTNIVNAQGEVVSMRGINFGSWLMMESWLSGVEVEWHDHLLRLASEIGLHNELAASLKGVGEFDDDTVHVLDHIAKVHALLAERVSNDQHAAYLALVEKEPPVFAARDMDAILTNRFGPEGAATFWGRFHDTWITEQDFQLAAALGFNFVRIPFWYRWFEQDDAPFEYSDYGFAYLDRAIAWAERHDLYVMLDFHGAPGTQSPWDHTGELSRNKFFSTPAFQERTAALWKAIAQRYADRPSVFAYDALNEPFGAPDPGGWTAAHALVYDAIREVDPDTIIVMEDGYKVEDPPYKDEGFFPIPAEMGWKQVVYSMHFYSGPDPLLTEADGTANHANRVDEVIRVGRMEQTRCGVPMYIGEFSTMNDSPNDLEGMRVIISALNQAGFHWSPWNWKFVSNDEKATIWGLYQFAEDWPGAPNMNRDSLESLLAVVDRLRTTNFRLHPVYGRILRECLAQPVSRSA